MKKFINKLYKLALSTVLGCYCLTSCQSIDPGSFSEDLTEQSEVVTNAKTKDVTFVMKGLDEEYVTSKASMTSVGCTDLYVMEGDSCLAHKVSTDTDFESPTVSLNYGTHSLTFIASASIGQSFTNKHWTCTKVGDTFTTTLDVTVSSTSSKSRQIQLTRRASKLVFTIQDKIPTNVDTLHIIATNFKGLTSSIEGTDSTSYEVKANIASMHGKSGYAPSITLLTKSASEQCDCKVTVEFLDKNSNSLFKYERTVKLQSNYCTNLTGNYFTGASNLIEVTTDWGDEIITPLFE